MSFNKLMYVFSTVAFICTGWFMVMGQPWEWLAFASVWSILLTQVELN